MILTLTLGLPFSGNVITSIFRLRHRNLGISSMPLTTSTEKYIQVILKWQIPFGNIGK
jgi:hypothetical protein